MVVMVCVCVCVCVCVNQWYRLCYKQLAFYSIHEYSKIKCLHQYYYS